MQRLQEKVVKNSTGLTLVNPGVAFLAALEGGFTGLGVGIISWLVFGAVAVILSRERR